MTSGACEIDGSLHPLAAGVVVSLHATEGCGLRARLGVRLTFDDCINVTTLVCGMAVFVTHTTHQVAVAAVSPHMSHVQVVGLVVADIAHSPVHGELFNVNS